MLNLILKDLRILHRYLLLLLNLFLLELVNLRLLLPQLQVQAIILHLHQFHLLLQALNLFVLLHQLAHHVLVRLDLEVELALQVVVCFVYQFIFVGLVDAQVVEVTDAERKWIDDLGAT